MYPRITASSQTHDWVLAPHLEGDFFGFRATGAASLLLLGMHLLDPLPWICARNPVFTFGEQGQIDLASKRILGKRYREGLSLEGKAEDQYLQPLLLVMAKLRELEPQFPWRTFEIPDLQKTPGKLLPRKLSASATVVLDEEQWTLYSRNVSELSQCLHAEITLILALSVLLSQRETRPVLKRFHLNTTLKPCKMCAAFLHQLRGNFPDFAVSYEEDDPGPLARHTLLDRYGYFSRL